MSATAAGEKSSRCGAVTPGRPPALPHTSPSCYPPPARPPPNTAGGGGYPEHALSAAGGGWYSELSASFTFISIYIYIYIYCRYVELSANPEQLAAAQVRRREGGCVGGKEMGRDGGAGKEGGWEH